MHLIWFQILQTLLWKGSFSNDCGLQLRHARPTPFCKQSVVYMRECPTYLSRNIGPYATKYQIDQVVLKDNKYCRYEIEVADDEEKTAEQPIRVILLKPLEGKILLFQRICFTCIENANVLKTFYIIWLISHNAIPTNQWV